MATPDSPVFIPRPGARVLLVNAAGRVLLLRGSDPARPGVRYWFTVGGGLDAGETPAEGAARELYEETGLSVPVTALGERVWHEVAEFPFDGLWYRQEQEFFLVRVGEWQVSQDGWCDLERRTVDAVRWWSVPELETTDETYYPVELPVLLRRLLAGGEV
ncbi:MAG: NUDIX hydrolase [Micromonosporaceae bacterium]